MAPNSPLKGRTASNRSRNLIRTGADAVAEANERRAAAAAMGTEGMVVASSTNGDDEDDDIAGMRNCCRRELMSNASNSNNIRRRHKRPKLNYTRSRASTVASWNSGGDGEQELPLSHHHRANDQMIYSIHNHHHLSTFCTDEKLEEPLSIPSSSPRCMPRHRFDIGTPDSCSDQHGGVESTSARSSTTSCSTRVGTQTFDPSSSSSSSRKKSQQRLDLSQIGTPQSSSDDGCSNSISSSAAGRRMRKTYTRVMSRQIELPEPGTPGSSSGTTGSNSHLIYSQSGQSKMPDHGTTKSSNESSCSRSRLSSTARSWERIGPSSPSSFHKSRLDNIPEHDTPKSCNDDSCTSSIMLNTRTRERICPTSPSPSRKSQREKIGRRKESSPDTRGSNVPSSQESSTSTTPQAVTLGGHRRFRDDTTTQDMGNYRMLIDDLSYLSSAIIQSRKESRTTTTTSSSSPCRLRNRNKDLAELASHHTAVTAGAACGIAELVSDSDTRVKLLTLTAKSARGGAKVGAIEAILESVACAPDAPNWSVVCQNMIDDYGSCQPGGEHCNNSPRGCEDEAGHHTAVHLPSNILRRSEYDIISSKALSIVSYFVGIDCTESAILSDAPINRLAIQLTRETVLQHKSALRGIARLVADDPVVNAYLREARRGDKLPAKTESLEKTRFRSSNKVFLASFHQQNLKQSSQCDPTKLGRRNRKKRISQLSDLPSSNISADLPSKSSLNANPMFGTRDPHILPCRERSADVDFSFNDGEASSLEGHESEVNFANKFDDKILFAMSRIKLTRDNEFGLSFGRPDHLSDCAYCSVWAPLLISHLDFENKDSFTSTSSLALVAADFIINGRDRWSAELNTDLQDDVDDGLLCLAYSNKDHASHGLMSENPIVYANEMLRLSGSLPQYSQSMSGTLLAILLSMNKQGAKCCSECTTYLQKRAFAISEIIDSMCCLSPNVSMTLSNRESYLVPSLLRVILEVSLSMDDDWSFLYVDTASAALKTLTSLTHENSVASGQMLESLPWESSCPISSQENNSSNYSIGVGIIFRYLFRTVSLVQTRSVHQKMMYDHTIFCLNILTNTVEMEPNEAKRVLEAIVVEVDGGTQQISGLSWLAAWIVSTTSGFRESIIKGSFGSSASTADDNELKTGDDDNLVTSGNGFVLLAYLMIGDDFSSRNIRDVVLKELPSDHNGVLGGLQFIVKVLKAFCNYYHYTVGDISVAVIAPVVKLISGLELLELRDQKGQSNSAT